MCVLEQLLVICEDPFDLGVAELDQTYTGTADSGIYADAVTTTCVPDVERSGPEYAIRFEVDALAVARFRMTGNTATFEWVFELRNQCESATDPDDPEDSAFCTFNDSLSFVARPGEEYWVVAEPADGIIGGEFDWELELTASQCTSSERTCNGATTVLDCFGGMDTTLDCGTACTDGVCAGDTCANALVVTAPMSWSGDIDAFSSSFDFELEPSCGGDPEGMVGTSSPGPDLVLSVPGLTAGQIVTVDSSMDDIDNGIFVVDTCDPATAACLQVADVADVLEWTVPADGDYFIVIDNLDGAPNAFNYSIDIQ